MREECIRFRVVHRTAYRYAMPVVLLPHRLVVRPREGHDVRIERFELSLAPAAAVIWSRDIFGNSIARVHFHEPGDELRIDVEFVAHRLVLSSDQTLIAPAPIPHRVEYDLLEQAVTSAYCAPVYPADEPQVNEWLRAQRLAIDSMAAVDLVLELTRRVHAQIRYRRRDERGVQAPAATLTLESGSCRDQATLLMECLRHLGIASRFVSGYLDCAATRASRGSTHAWCEAYFPNLGWHGFDPTTGQGTGHQHIVVAVSHHPRGVMPVSGRFLGAPDSLREMTVSVLVEEIPATSLLAKESILDASPG